MAMDIGYRVRRIERVVTPGGQPVEALLSDGERRLSAGDDAERTTGQAGVRARDLDMPTGMIAFVLGSVVPDGWLECDGRELWGPSYPRLRTQIGAQFGQPTNGGNFRLPGYADLSAAGSPLYVLAAGGHGRWIVRT